MSDPVVMTLRKEVAQRICLANASGGYEGTHTDFKLHMEDNEPSFGKLIKHLLSFANTPRQTYALIIYGVDEVIIDNTITYNHVGVSEKNKFPNRDKIYTKIVDVTDIEGIEIDDGFIFNGLLTPFIAVPFQSDGPRRLTKKYWKLDCNTIYRRYGSNSLPAYTREIARMKNDWAKWSIDCRYESSSSSLERVIRNKFNNLTKLNKQNDYIRFILSRETTDEFGINIKNVLVHAYWGFDTITDIHLNLLISDNVDPVSEKIIIGTRFSESAISLADKSFIRHKNMRDIYGINDPYAKYCNNYLDKWNTDLSDRHLSKIVDLSYYIDGKPQQENSIILYLEELITTSQSGASIVVHGAFGSGKTMTAKQFVADICKQYLKYGDITPKVIYVDANNYDIRAKRGECLQSQLFAHDSLTRADIDKIIAKVNADEVILVFDGVDEMGKPHNSEGRNDAIDLLMDTGNNATSIYLVRTSYFPNIKEMIDLFNTKTKYNIDTGKRNTYFIKVAPLSEEQVLDFLNIRLDQETAKKIITTIKKLHLDSFLKDPLIITYFVDSIITENIVNINEIDTIAGKSKAHILSNIIKKMLKREQDKRFRHDTIFKDFMIFQKILRNIAFSMVCSDNMSAQTSIIENYIKANLKPNKSLKNELDAFKTVSWIHESSDKHLQFRHDSLTLFCAAEYINIKLEEHNYIDLQLWRQGMPFEDVVIEYVCGLISIKALVGALSMVTQSPANVRQLIVMTMNKIKDNLPALDKYNISYESGYMAKMIDGIIFIGNLSHVILKSLFKSLSSKQRIELGLPLLYKLSMKYLSTNRILVIEVISIIVEETNCSQGNIYAKSLPDLLKEVSKNKDNYVDKLLLSHLKITQTGLI